MLPLGAPPPGLNKLKRLKPDHLLVAKRHNHDTPLRPPLLDLQADSCACVWNGSAPVLQHRYLYFNLSKHVMRTQFGTVSRLRLRAHTLVVESSTWRSLRLRGHEDSAFVLLCKMRCIFFFTRKNLRFSFLLPLLPVLFYGTPFYFAHSILHALPSQTIFDFLLQWHNKLCHFISDIIFSCVLACKCVR